MARLIPGAGPFAAPGTGTRRRTGVAVLHGFTGNPNATRPLGRRLVAEGYAVVVPRLPGHGTDWRELARTRYADWRAAADRAVVDLAARCETVVVVGLSVGGTIALDIASRRHDRVHGVVAINPQILDRPELLARVGRYLRFVVPALPKSLFGVPVNDIARPGADERAYSVVPTRAAWSWVAELPRVRARLRRMTTPVLVVYALGDRTIDPANGQAVARMAGGHDVTTLALERSRHVATLDHDAGVLEDAVIRFVERIAATRERGTEPAYRDADVRRGGDA